MRAVANGAIVVGAAILALVLAATALSAVFATRSAMATNRPTIEVLHFIGAKHSYVAGQFQRRFLMLGLTGGAIGGGAAALVFALIGLMSGGFGGRDSTSTLLGGFGLGIGGYAAILGQVFLAAAVTAVTSRRVVNRMLNSIE
jgi:cell division transport system permease protein